MEMRVTAQPVPFTVCNDDDDCAHNASDGLPHENETICEIGTACKVFYRINIQACENTGTQGKNRSDNGLGRTELPKSGFGKYPVEQRHVSGSPDCPCKSCNYTYAQGQPEEVFTGKRNEDPFPVHEIPDYCENRHVGGHPQWVPTVNVNGGEIHRQERCDSGDCRHLAYLRQCQPHILVEEYIESADGTGHSPECGKEKYQPIDLMSEGFLKKILEPLYDFPVFFAKLYILSKKV